MISLRSCGVCGGADSDTNENGPILLERMAMQLPDQWSFSSRLKTILVIIVISMLIAIERRLTEAERQIDAIINAFTR